MSRSATTTVR